MARTPVIRIGRRWCLAALLAAGCQAQAARQTRPASPAPQSNEAQKTMTTPMKPAQSARFVAGPAIRPSGPLLDWLNDKVAAAPGPRKRVRLPVVVRFEDQYRLAIGEAFIGAAPGAAGDDAIFLSLDDTGMSVALLDILRDRCPKSADACAVWLEGHWGPLVDVPMPDLDLPGEPEDDRKRWPFAVLQVHDLIDAKAGGDETPRALVEAPAP